MEETKVKEKKKVSNSTKFTILAIILIAIFCFALTPVTLQNDTYYTIKIGEHIQNVGIDMKDPFSWHEGLSYTYPHWLYDLVTYWVYAAFNMDGVYILTCILSCVLGISLFITNKKLMKNEVLAFIVAIGSMYLIQAYICARAQLVTYILFVWEVFFIEQYLSSKKKRYGVFLILISLLIANLHVAVWPFYFIVFLPYIGEYVVSILGDLIIYHKIGVWFKNLQVKRYGKLIEKIKDQEKAKKYQQKMQRVQDKLQELNERVEKVKKSRAESIKKPYKLYINKNNAVKGLIIIMIIAAFMGLITPIGDTPYTYLYKTMEGITTQNINEHQPMTLINETNMICVLIVFLAILIFTKTKIKLSDLFMIGGLIYMMFASKRHLTMFILIGGFVLTRLLVDMFKRYDINAKNFVNFLVKPISAIILSIFILCASVHFIKPKINDDYIDDKAYPVAACDFILNESGIDLSKARFYNEYNYGSYLLFRGIPVFIDSRADLYAPEFNPDIDIFTDFINCSNIGEYYEDTFEKYDITHVICYKTAKVNMIITKSEDPNYKLLYEDDFFVVYERLSAQM